MNVAVIGGGWYGCHLALCLRRRGHNVTILEKNSDIFMGVSGKFGIRLHKGPHYPRSENTRERCRATYHQFCLTYPDLVIDHEYSIYALGTIDSLGNPSKVSLEEFTNVCFEDPSCTLIDLASCEYQNLLMAAIIEEPSIAVGNKVRETFRGYLKDADVRILCNYEVTALQITNSTNMLVVGMSDQNEYEQVVNCSGYHSVLPSRLKVEFPFPMETRYQPCIALVYADMETSLHEKPFSFIVMDGWFPCVMPYIEGDSSEFRSEGSLSKEASTREKYALYSKYILTHGNYTIMASCQTPIDAYDILRSMSDEYVATHIKPLCEREINRFWPAFSRRFKYISWKGEVLCKLRTQKEFRGSVIYGGPYGVIHVVPGKISNIFDAEEEMLALMDKVPGTILQENRYSYVKGGVLDHAQQEISEFPDANDMQNTCALNTFVDVNKAAVIAGTLKSNADCNA